MTSVERIRNILLRKPVDRIGVSEHFWGDTHKKWRDEGHLGEDEPVDDHFGFDILNCWPFNLVADMDFEPVTLEETEETILQKDGNGATGTCNWCGRHGHIEPACRQKLSYVAKRQGGAGGAAAVGTGSNPDDMIAQTMAVLDLQSGNARGSR